MSGYFRDVNKNQSERSVILWYGFFRLTEYEWMKTMMGRSKDWKGVFRDESREVSREHYGVPRKPLVRNHGDTEQG